MRHILRFALLGICILTIYLLSGCTVPVTVTSDPPGATVYVAPGHRSGIFEPVGTTPYSYSRVFTVEHYKVVWRDGVESKIQSSVWDWGDSKIVHHFEKRLGGHRTDVATIQPMQVNAPWGPIQVVSYTYDEQTQKGQLSVDISERGFEIRRWIIKNIGEICSNQNIALEAGKEPTKGGYYKILKESVKDGILTIEFKALY